VAVVGILLLVAGISIIVYYAIAIPTENSFGERYVTTVISPPYPLNELTTFKPVTLMTYFFFAGTVLVLEASKKRLSRFNSRGLRMLLVTSAFAAGYEYVWNMFAWFTIWFKNGGVLDLTANTLHDPIFPPVNFNFATKISFLIFALCLYCWYFLRGVMEESKPANK